jgi:heat shock protein 5
VQIIPNDQGNRITPSYVAFTETERLIGDAAKNQASLNPENTVFDVKRLIGRKYSDKEVQADKKLVPYAIVDRDGKPFIQVSDQGSTKTYSPEEISAMILTKMKEIAEAYLGEKVTHAVVTVPAYFNDAQRQATKDAGAIAGLTVMRIINEPTAAAIAYGLDQKIKDKNILVYDLGGGTFDVTVLSIDQGVFEVLATNGDTHLGGEDFDQRLMQYFLGVIQKKHGKDLSKNQRAIARLRREVEKAKRAVSSQHSVAVDIESLIDGEDFHDTLTRAKFEELNVDLFRKTIKPVTLVLQDAHMKKGDIAEIVFVGGSTRIPKVQQMIKDFFNGKEPNLGINPDEAVAYGAAVQGGILAGKGGEETKDVLLLDVTPLSMGIETIGGVMSTIIDRNTVIPIKKSQMYTTTEDNQDTLDVKIYQGERAMVKDNVLLGRFDLTGIPPAPKEVPELEVTFEIDANGILHVAAQDKGTGKRESLTITAEKGRLSEAEIARMVKEAEQYAEEDKKKRKVADARIKLEGYAFSLKRQISDKDKLGGRLSKDDKKAIEDAVKETVDWLDDHSEANLEEFEAQQKALEDVANPIITKIYGAAGNPHAESHDSNFEAGEHEEL